MSGEEWHSFGTSSFGPGGGGASSRAVDKVGNASASLTPFWYKGVGTLQAVATKERKSRVQQSPGAGLASSSRHVSYLKGLLCAGW